MKKMRRLNALGNAWQLVTYVGMVYDKFNVLVKYTEEYVKVSIFGNEPNYVNLDELNSWIKSNVDRFDNIQLNHVDNIGLTWLEVTWYIKEE